MDTYDHMKWSLYLLTGTLGAFIVELMGGWDIRIQALVVLMAIDFISGFIAAAVFKQSMKTESGRAESNTMFKGLLRKAMCLCIVIVGCIVDILAESHAFVRNSVIIALSIREILSFIENLGLMGVPLPDVLMHSLDALYKKAGEKKKGGDL